MASCKVIEYKGIEIVFTDISNANVSDAIHAFEHSCEIIKNYPLGSVYALVHTKNAKFSMELVEKIKEVVKRNQPYNRATAVTGLDSMTMVFARSIGVLTGRSLKFLSTPEEGKEYLFKESQKNQMAGT